MKLRIFIPALALSFGAAWLAVVVLPYFSMRDLAPLPMDEESGDLYFPKRAGRIKDGAEVYAANGCAQCHSQLVRPTYAGNDMFREDWGGRKMDPERGDTRRETNAWDFEGERVAHLGETRVGPDLSNVGLRAELKEQGAETWLLEHLYNPRNSKEAWKSACPPMRFLFEEREIKGAPSDEALAVGVESGREVVPGSQAKALVSYLLSLKKDHAVPPALDFASGK